MIHYIGYNENGAEVLTKDGEIALMDAFTQHTPQAETIQAVCFLWAQKLISNGLHSDLMLLESRNKLVDMLKEMEHIANVQAEETH